MEEERPDPEAEGRRPCLARDDLCPPGALLPPQRGW